MKIWIKLVIGIIIGLIIAVVIPSKQAAAVQLANISEILIQIARYAIFPLVFFSLTIGTYELKLDKRVFRVYGRMFLYMILSTAVLVLVGVISVLLFSPRIPIITIKVPPPQIPGFMETLFSIFPQNAFSVLVGDGNILLPIVVLCYILGANLTFDRVITRPIIQLFDSLSRTFYHIISLVVEIFWVLTICITANVVVQIALVENLQMYGELILILVIDIAVVVFGIYPGLLYLIDRETNPYKLLYASLAPALSGLITGNEYVPVGLLVKHGRENLGIPRRVGSAVYPFFAIFGRAGTALVSSVSFFLIANSLLPSADIDFVKIFYVFAFSFIVSFALGAVPGLGTYVAITLLCYQFDRFWPTFGLLHHYKILEPIKILLVSFGVFVDVITSYLTSYLICYQEGITSPKDPRDFI
jgi:aerobic C4-dicarboxylate transport protein